jgi:hypothetical protein
MFTYYGSISTHEPVCVSSSKPLKSARRFSAGVGAIISVDRFDLVFKQIGPETVTFLSSNHDLFFI